MKTSIMRVLKTWFFSEEARLEVHFVLSLESTDSYFLLQCLGGAEKKSPCILPKVLES